MTASINVLFVCLGNICRSPTAEGVFRKQVATAGLEQQIRIDSCGTGDWHIGKGPDERAVAAAGRVGVDISGLRARQFEAEDLNSFDYVLVMDRQNLAAVKEIWRQNGGTAPRLFLDFADFDDQEVPDPYFGEDDGFQHVLELIHQAGEGLLNDIRGKLG
jgi:protein-tyrosine phosphatase